MAVGVFVFWSVLLMSLFLYAALKLGLWCGRLIAGRFKR